MSLTGDGIKSNVLKIIFVKYIFLFFLLPSQKTKPTFFLESPPKKSLFLQKSGRQWKTDSIIAPTFA